jgi:Carboxypeptidase regulatory-like domain/TonB dependent receptor-like, beta-barrel
LKSYLPILVILLLLRPAVHAQSLKGSIGGSVTDSSGKPITGVTVSLIAEETGRKRTGASDSRGDFVITLLAPGSYRLEVEREGFQKYVQTIDLLVDQEIRVGVSLQPGRRTEQVTVTTTRGTVKTDSAALGTVIDNRQIRGLPLDGRNFLELSLLVPGSAPAAPGSAGSVRGDLSIHVNGAREDSNAFLLDGVYNGDPKLNTVGITPPVDAIQEFEILTSTYDASFGRNAGGQVNVVVRSGSNGVHGTAYEFFRNAALDSKNYFASANEPEPKYQRNQFGASLGGPVKKDRTFFFADYEGRRVREGVTRVTNVPTALERAGDFSRSNPYTPPIDLFTQAPFPGSKIPANRLHPIGVGIAALYPLPNRADPQQNFVSSPTSKDRDDHFDVRLDHSVSSSSEVAVRYSFADRSLFEPFSGPGFSVVPGYGNDVPRRAQNLMLSETHIFSSSILNELRLGFNRVALGVTQEGQGVSVNRKLGLPDLSTNPRDFGLTFITVPGYSPLGDEGNNPQHGVANTYQILDNLTYTRGRHLMKFGAEFRTQQQNAFRDVQSRGFINFLGFTGNPLSELLQGLPGVSGGARLDNPQHLRTQSYNFFAQDSFRIRPNLTLSMGVRYEYNTPAVDAQDRANVYDPATQALVAVGKNGFPRSGYEADRNNFAPRVGLAWTPGSQKSTVLRAGYGLYYDQSALAPGEGLYFSAPYFDLKLYFTLLPDLPLLLNDPFPKFFPIPIPSSALAFQRDLRTGYLQDWNFSVQQQIGKDRVLELAYVGSKGTKLLTGRDINQPLHASPAQFNPRPVPQFGDVDILESHGDSTYNSFQARVQQRYHAGLTLLGSYTWSKSIDDASGFFSSAGDPNFPQDSYNMRAERGRSNFDLRHRLSVSYAYDLPVAKGHRLLGGWQTFGILTFQTGRPFTVALQQEVDNSNTGRTNLGFGNNDRPNVIGNPSLSNQTPDRWFNTAAFVVPTFGNFGNSGRNILTGPGYSTVNLSLMKNTSVGEHMRVQFRVEAFNLLDRTNFDLPDIYVGSPTFGRIQSAGSPRHVQLGLKLLF